MGCEVAWNCVKLKDFTSDEITCFSHSVQLNRQLYHKNIVSVNTSWVCKSKSELVIITEIVTGGSLKAYLLRLPNPRFRLIKNWCRGILNGLKYLHSQNPPVVHSELTTQSIYLMSSDGTIKLSDFYLNKLMPSHSPLLASPEYLAPEVFYGIMNPKSDIYSFGMTLLEMCTQSRPYSECSSSAQVLSRIKQKVFPESLSRIEDQQLKSIIELCLQSLEDRPSSEDLLNNPFFSEDSPSKNNHPVQLHTTNSDPPSRKRHIKTLSLILRDSKNCAKSVSFDFNPESDTPEKVAIEMIESFNLDKTAVIKVAKEIEKKLEIVKSPRLGVQIFKSKDHHLEPHTAGIVNRKLPVLSSHKSVDDSSHTQYRVREMLAVLYGNQVITAKSIRCFVEQFQSEQGIEVDGQVSEKFFKLLTHRIGKYC